MSPFIQSDENLLGTEAMDKIKKISAASRVAMLGTGSGGIPVHFYPMVVQAVDDFGTFWFLSARSSEKNRHIAQDPHVQIVVCNPADSQYLSVEGVASIDDSRELREKYWSRAAKTWFPGGVDDPELTVIVVHVERGHYWDTSHGKTVSFFLSAIGVLTGKTADFGVEGEVLP